MLNSTKIALKNKRVKDVADKYKESGLGIVMADGEPLEFVREVKKDELDIR